jgi:2-dehydropantoate 2-reductase
MRDDPLRIGVVGAGAIGSSVAADLTEAGYDVTVVDQWPAQVEAIKAGTLRIVMTDRELHAAPTALHLCELASERPTFDLVLLAVKSYDTTWLTHLIAPYLAEDGVFVGLQNSMNEEMIVPIIGAERTIASVVELSGEIWEPGVVQRDTNPAGTWFGLGELDGSITPRVERIAEILRVSAQVSVTDNILGAKWTKLVANSMTMGPFSLFGIKNWDAAALPGMTEISVRIGRESAAVGTALGYRLEPIFGMTPEQFAGSGDEALVAAMRTLLSHIGKDSTTATVQDARKGRKTELEYITGTMTRKGREVGVPTPVNDAVLRLGREIEAGTREMTPENLDDLKDLIGS